MPGYVRNRGKTKAVVRNGKVVKKPRTKWQARWRHPEDSRKPAERYFPTKTLAEQWIEQQDKDAWAGTLVDTADAKLTFAEVVEGWRETWMNLEPKTRAGYDNILARRILPEFGERRIRAGHPRRRTADD